MDLIMFCMPDHNVILAWTFRVNMMPKLIAISVLYGMVMVHL